MSHGNASRRSYARPGNDLAGRSRTAAFHAKQEQGSKVRMTTSRSHGPRLLLFVQSSSRDGPPGSALVHAKAVDSQEGGLNSATTAAPGSGFVLFAGLFEEPGFGHEGRAHRRRRGDRHDRHRRLTPASARPRPRLVHS